MKTYTPQKKSADNLGPAHKFTRGPKNEPEISPVYTRRAYLNWKLNVLISRIEGSESAIPDEHLTSLKEYYAQRREDLHFLHAQALGLRFEIKFLTEHDSWLKRFQHLDHAEKVYAELYGEFLDLIQKGTRG